MEKTANRVRALSIAGVDPSGGAGILADVKSFTAFGAYAMAVVTSLTAQNTCGVSGIHTPPASFLEEQLNSISQDVEVDTVKIGMLGNSENVLVVRDWLAKNRPQYVVLDPVMVATSNDRLLDTAAEGALFELAKLADVITPNLPELAVLLGIKHSAQVDEAKSWSEAVSQASELVNHLNVIVYLKGGHLSGVNAGRDALITPAQSSGEPELNVVELETSWVNSQNTHGTGCSFSSALAALRPQVDDWEMAARNAKEWLTSAIMYGENLQVGDKNASGQSHGPVDHLWNLKF